MIVALEEAKYKLVSMRPVLKELGSALRVDELRAKADELEKETLEPDFWSNQERSSKILQTIKQSKDTVAEYEALCARLEDAITLAEMAIEENDESSVPEVQAELEEIMKQEEHERTSILLSGEYDHNNAIVSFHPGAGGTEAQDWALMLYRMITRWAEQNGYKVKLTDWLDGEEAGIKSATIFVEGPNAYGYLKSENGVHRLVRVSPFDAAGRRQTSFASIEVMPEFDKLDEVVVRDEDYDFIPFHSSGAGGQNVNKVESGVRLRYNWKNPNTGVVEEILIECTETRDQPKNKERALSRLRTFIYDKEHQKYIDDIASKRKTMVSTGDRSVKIRTYNYPQGRITDHRINYTIYNLSAFMDGDIQDCIDHLIVAENAERLKESEL